MSESVLNNGSSEESWKNQSLVVKNFYDLWGFIGGTTLGKYPEINEGIYPTLDTSYDQAMENVYEWYLKNTIGQVKKDRPYKVLELGFGYGSLADRFVKTGKVIWTGINYSPIQCKHARKEYKLDTGPNKIYQMSWYDFPFDQHTEQYDFVVARGCLEHYVPRNEAAKGNERSKEIYADLFAKLHRCLKPQAKNDGAGKIIGGLIFMRNPWTDEQVRAIDDEREYERFSDLYFTKKLARTWGGHYPSTHAEFFSYLDKNLKQIVLEDGTRDYYCTSSDWFKLIRKNLIRGILTNPLHILSYFMYNRSKSFSYIKDIFVDGVWGWQFTPRLDFKDFSDTPCCLNRFVYQVR